MIKLKIHNKYEFFNIFIKYFDFSYFQELSNWFHECDIERKWKTYLTSKLFKFEAIEKYSYVMALLIFEVKKALSLMICQSFTENYIYKKIFLIKKIGYEVFGMLIFIISASVILKKCQNICWFDNRI